MPKLGEITDAVRERLAILAGERDLNRPSRFFWVQHALDALPKRIAEAQYRGIKTVDVARVDERSGDDSLLYHPRTLKDMLFHRVPKVEWLNDAAYELYTRCTLLGLNPTLSRKGSDANGDHHCYILGEWKPEHVDPALASAAAEHVEAELAKRQRAADDEIAKLPDIIAQAVLDGANYAKVCKVEESTWTSGDLHYESPKMFEYVPPTTFDQFFRSTPKREWLGEAAEKVFARCEQLGLKPSLESRTQGYGTTHWTYIVIQWRPAELNALLARGQLAPTAHAA